jgi:ATP adenylyltransferase
MEYINRGADERGCVFCLAWQGEDQQRLVLYRGHTQLVLLNRYPYNPGHVLIAPSRHTSELAELSAPECTEMMGLLQCALRVLDAAMGPQGYNLGMNLGAIAGAGLADHLHLHVVPRWQGDTNFMPVVGETKVMPELLTETWRKLRPLFQGLGVRS